MRNKMEYFEIMNLARKSYPLANEKWLAHYVGVMLTSMMPEFEKSIVKKTIAQDVPE